MSLKRKASFSGLPSSMAMPTPSGWGMSDSSKDLPSRTRKRFRDGRPDEQVTTEQLADGSRAEKTLRWIFSAQQQQQRQPITPMDTADDAMMDADPSIPSPETIDPRQQTLLRFFQPRAEASSPFRPSREALAARANETAMDQEEVMRRQAFAQMNMAGSTSGSETTSPGFFQTETDVDMDMDGGESSDSSNPVAKWGFWNGGV
ncbi:hypothetical protein PEBR_22145 [Penicillium brasilianum]|uniref:Uncharacterized protein n=1 Tax=Penicillium brasilianum TaxID=104259 RepID=A0A1S9RMH5_PENBI|nr:hypothetical protein PEBR_22145 [Penicillium brasilianum]